MNNPPNAHENSHVPQAASGGVSGGSSPALSGMGGTIAGSLVGGAMTMLGNYIQQKYYERNLKSQFDYNEQAAENADKRQRALYYDLYSPEAQKQMYLSAGFSPSILYSGGAASSQGATPHGAQGAGANMSMPAMAPLNLNTQLAMTAAQIELMKSEARKNNVDADTQEGKTPLGEANLKSILSNIGLNDSVTALNRIQEEINKETKDFQIKTIEHNLYLIQNQAEHEYWAACDAELQFDFNEQNFDTNCKIIDESLSNLIADTALKRAKQRETNVNIDKLNKEIELMSQQISESVARIQQGWKQLALTARGQTLDWRLGLRMQEQQKQLKEQELKYVKEKIEQTEDLTEKGFWIDILGKTLNAASTISAALIVGNRMQGNPGRPVVRGFQ